MFITRTVLLALLITLAGATSAPAQVLKKVQQQVKQKIAGAKMRLEDSVATHATEPLDSALSHAAKPVDSTAARAGGGASSVLTNAVRRKESNAEERHMRESLAAGRLELTSLTFDAEVPSEASRPQLEALGRVLTSLPNTFLIQVRHEPAVTSGSTTTTLAEQRAAALKAWLVARGVSATRLFGATNSEGSTSGALVVLIRLQ